MRCCAQAPAKVLGEALRCRMLFVEVLCAQGSRTTRVVALWDERLCGSLQRFACGADRCSTHSLPQRYEGAASDHNMDDESNLLGPARHSTLVSGEINLLGSARLSKLVDDESNLLGPARHSTLVTGEFMDDESNLLGPARHSTLVTGSFQTVRYAPF